MKTRFSIHQSVALQFISRRLAAIHEAKLHLIWLKLLTNLRMFDIIC